MIDDYLGLDGRAFDLLVARWWTRLETDGQGGLVEIPVRPLSEGERRLLDCSMSKSSAGLEADVHVPDALGPAGRRQAAVLDTVLARGGVTIGELIDGLGLPRSTAKSALAGLRSRGLIRIVGAGRDASYVPTPLGLAVPPISRAEAGNGPASTSGAETPPP